MPASDKTDPDFHTQIIQLHQNRQTLDQSGYLKELPIIHTFNADISEHFGNKVPFHSSIFLPVSLLQCYSYSNIVSYNKFEEHHFPPKHRLTISYIITRFFI